MSDQLPIETVGQYMEQAPVDIEGLATALGLAINRELWPDNKSGKIECEANGGPCTITVNAMHPESRQRFTIAHEIAHFILHRDAIGDGIVDDGMYRSGRSEKIERQANQYAAEILMPWKIVIQKYRAGHQTPTALAREFKVSPAVAEIRMKELRSYL
ncbi:ImmA/IrrE family metallo-endopeptidase [Methylocystis sp. H4A]|uniref:ImmA/IrrE family metallo-endopeptidase n=1 Tax=Methylocystis sp. H4A TaxID=2785788 RepID=UPI001AED849D